MTDPSPGDARRPGHHDSHEYQDRSAGERECACVFETHIRRTEKSPLPVQSSKPGVAAAQTAAGLAASVDFGFWVIAVYPCQSPPKPPQQEKRNSPARDTAR